jgi:hypothetical protein
MRWERGWRMTKDILTVPGFFERIATFQIFDTAGEK